MEKVSKVKKTKKEKKLKVAEPEKVTEKAPVAEESTSARQPHKEEKKIKRYLEATGRRKSAIARVRLLTIKPFEGDEGKITINDKFYKQYFPATELQQIVEAALRRLKSLNRFEVVARVRGGGSRAQAEAVRHGLARTLVKFNTDFRKKLKKAGYLKRDPRVKERRKYGLKKARRAPQWAKR
ncbi:MAG: small subunit ribosomal protein S9 [Parcubacteria group bacterium LiPW_39]|nr:MAG: small subunit ribosomal protein S9 [Parcubacteria group bacterium LiPW_39]